MQKFYLQKLVPTDERPKPEEGKCIWFLEEREEPEALNLIKAVKKDGEITESIVDRVPRRYEVERKYKK